MLVTIKLQNMFLRGEEELCMLKDEDYKHLFFFLLETCKYHVNLEQVSLILQNDFLHGLLV